MISVVLVEPGNSGNVGAVARAMANFGFSSLVLVNPRCNHLSQTARNRAKWANGILSKAKKVKSLSSIKSTLVATTGKLGTDYNINRSPITPASLSEIKAGNIAVVFGRESSGLTNQEISKCDFVVAIPASKKYPTLNLSHAVAVILYELAKKKENVSSHIMFASKPEKDQLLKLLNSAMKKMKFKNSQKKKTQLMVWKRMIGKSFLTKREAYALMGFLKKI
jgi:TrmH family RNA methyltransferase